DVHVPAGVEVDEDAALFGVEPTGRFPGSVPPTGRFPDRGEQLPATFTGELDPAHDLFGVASAAASGYGLVCQRGLIVGGVAGHGVHTGGVAFGQCPEQLFRKLFRLRRVEVDALAAGDHQYGVSSDGGDAHAERTLVDGGEGVVLDPRALHHVHRFEELFVDAALAEQAGLLEFLVGVAASLYQFFVGIPTVAAAEHGRWFAEVVVFQQHHVGLQTYGEV